MKILITGATGFVGQALCRRLEQQGMAFVRLLREAHAGVNDVVVGDIRNPSSWAHCAAGADAFVHLAAHVHQRAMPGLDASARIAINSTATENLARSAAAHGIPHFLFLSTAKVMGESTSANHSFSESDEPVPQDDYARSKWHAEQRLRVVSKETGLGVTIIRPPLVYGPGVRANFLSLLRLADSPWPLPLGSIDNCRSFVFIENLTSAIMSALRRGNRGVSTYLVSDQHDLSTAELVSMLRAQLGRPGRIVPIPAPMLRLAGRLLGRLDDTRRLTESLRLDTRRISAALDWSPEMSVEEGLARTCNWYRTARIESNL